MLFIFQKQKWLQQVLCLFLSSWILIPFVTHPNRKALRNISISMVRIWYVEYIYQRVDHILKSDIFTETNVIIFITIRHHGFIVANFISLLFVKLLQVVWLLLLDDLVTAIYPSLEELWTLIILGFAVFVEINACHIVVCSYRTTLRTLFKSVVEALSWIFCPSRIYFQKYYMFRESLNIILPIFLLIDNYNETKKHVTREIFY